MSYKNAMTSWKRVHGRKEKALYFSTFNSTIFLLFQKGSLFLFCTRPNKLCIWPSVSVCLCMREKWVRIERKGAQSGGSTQKIHIN